MNPIIKYPGSKRWLTSLLVPHIKSVLTIDGGAMYFEPFVGSGAMFFALEWGNSVIRDLNPHLINVFLSLARRPDDAIPALERKLALYHMGDKAERSTLYYEIRSRYNDACAGKEFIWNPLAAASLLFLLKTCYNGLMRFNAKGGFNTPHGDYKAPRYDIDNLEAASSLLDSAHITVGDFEGACAQASRGDVLYLDPPYHGVYNGYSGKGFSWADQIRLHDAALAATYREAHVYVSLPDTAEMRTLWGSDEFHAYTIPVRRSISCKADTRGSTNELLAFWPESELPAFENYEAAF